MSLTFPFLRRRAQRPPKPARARRSVLVYLVALVIIPAMGMPAFAMLLSQERMGDADASRRIAARMRDVDALENLRIALRDERMNAGFLTTGKLYGLTADQVSGALGGVEIGSVAGSRESTDAAVARMRADSAHPYESAAIDALARGRRQVDEIVAAPSTDQAQVAIVVERYGLVETAISDGERAAPLDIIAGDLGHGSPEVLQAASRIEYMSLISEVVFRQMSTLQHLATEPATQQRATIEALERDLILGDAMVEDMPLRFRPDQVARWQALQETPLSVEFDRFLHSLVDGTRVAPDGTPEVITGLTPGLIDAGSATLEVSEDISLLFGEIIAEGITVAEEDAAMADRRAREAVLATAGLLILTGVVLILVGGTTRRRLRELAAAAEGLRAGRLEGVSVQGPREMALVAEALDDAVANFRRVAAQAEVLASGRLDDPELMEPVPGPLGSAVHGSVVRIVDVMRELDRLRNEMAHQAAHDRLTGLPNRGESERLLTQALHRAQRSESQAAVLFVDLDGFKQCNDTFGHEAGDHVLRTVSLRMVTCVRPGDTVCRVGGDEFLVIVEAATQDLAAHHASEIANRICSAVARPIPFQDDEILLGASVGVAVSDGATDPAVIRSKADAAMYRAKATRGGVEVFDEKLDRSRLPQPRSLFGPRPGSARSRMLEPAARLIDPPAARLIDPGAPQAV